MARIVAAGVAVLDFVMDVDAMPDRAEKYRARDATVVGGGCAATASVALARLGGEAWLAARLGDDSVGAMILCDLEDNGVDCRLARKFAGKKSSFSTIFVDAAGERLIVNFRDTSLDFGAEWLDAAGIPEFDAALADTRWPAGAAALMRIARERGKPGILDAEAPIDEAADALALCSHAAFSAQGLRDLTGDTDIGIGLARAAERTGAWVCVTDGQNGALWLEDGAVRHEPAHAVVVVDTLGAGDVWHGAFALRLGEGAPEGEAIRFANAAAAIKCTRFGGRAGAPTRGEVEQFLEERHGCG